MAPNQDQIRQVLMLLILDIAVFWEPKISKWVQLTQLPMKDVLLVVRSNVWSVDKFRDRHFVAISVATIFHFSVEQKSKDSSGILFLFMFVSILLCLALFCCHNDKKMPNFFDLRCNRTREKKLFLKLFLAAVKMQNTFFSETLSWWTS